MSTKKSNKSLPLSARIVRATYPLLEKVGLHKKIAYKYFFYPIKYPFPEVEVSYLKSAQIDELTIGKSTIKTYEWGNIGSSKKLLLVHGWAGRATQFRSIIDALSVDYHIYSFDAPGHGKSKGNTSDMLEIAEITKTIAEMKHIDIIAGHSLGGAACAYAHVQLNLKITKLLLISTPSTGKNMLLDFVNRIGGTETTRNYLKKTIKNHFDKDINDFFAGSYLPTSEFADCLAIHDEFDEDVRFEHLTDFKAMIPNLKTHVTQDLGHTKILRDKKVIEEIERFLI